MQPPFDEPPQEKIELSQKAARSVSGGEVNATQSAVQHLLAAEANIRQSSVGSAKGQRVSIAESWVLSVVGREVQADESRIFFVATPSFRGNVRPVLTVQSAFALGFGFFFGRWLTRRIGRLWRG